MTQPDDDDGEATPNRRVDYDSRSSSGGSSGAARSAGSV